MTTTALTIGMATDFLANAGNDAKPSDEWRRTEANPWTLVVTTTLGCESFHYWTGPAIKTEPTLADLVFCLAADSSFAETEPEELSQETRPEISANDQRMARLFGDLWERIKAYDEEEIQAAFGRFS